MGDYRYWDEEVPFNMAVATLMRLDAILKEIRNLNYLYPRDSAEKQKSYIELVKQFYLNAIPLLKDEDSEKYKEEILGMQIKKKAGIKSGTQTCSYIYDSKIDYRLNEILIELQQKLKPYFMPKGKDPSKAVINF